MMFVYLGTGKIILQLIVLLISLLIYFGGGIFIGCVLIFLMVFIWLYESSICKKVYLYK